MQMMVLTLSLVGMAVIGMIFVGAVRASGKEAEPAAGADGRRSRLIWVLLIAGVGITVASLWQWPHDVSANADAVAVNVSGAQWAWEIDKTDVPAGKTIVFNVHTKDVNHGMGVVDPNGTLLFQTQSMPGYVNQVRYVFDEPGTYRVICLEFCGVAHHGMIDEFEVTAGKS